MAKSLSTQDNTALKIRGHAEIEKKYLYYKLFFIGLQRVFCRFKFRE
jgi:hypothetical protein